MTAYLPHTQLHERKGKRMIGKLFKKKKPQSASTVGRVGTGGKIVLKDMGNGGQALMHVIDATGKYIDIGGIAS